jgi:type I restriction enzyme S subunit
MSSNTEHLVLGELVELCTDKAAGQKEPNIPYIGLEHIAHDFPLLLGTAPSNTSISTNSIFRPGDILFGKLRPNLRKSLQVNFNGYCSTDILVFRTRPGVSPEFAARVFQREDIFEEAVRTAEGTKMPRTSWDKLKTFRVFVPSDAAEQQRIAEILDKVDEAIARTESLIAKLKQMKAGLLHDLLTRGLDENGELRDAIAHPEQFKDSPLGQIPKEWEVVQLGSLSQMITSGSRGWAAYYSDQGAIFLRMGNLTREHMNLRLDNLVHVCPHLGSEGARAQVQSGDVLISITADLGIIGVIPHGFEEAYVNQHIALVRLEQSQANPRWIGNYLATGVGQKQFYRLNDVGAKSGLNLPTVARLFVALPSMREQREIAAIVDGYDTRIRAEETYLNKLKLQKQGLMHDLLTGKVRVN